MSSRTVKAAEFRVPVEQSEQRARSASVAAPPSQTGERKSAGGAGTHPHLLVSVLGRVLAALALPPQLLQLGLALLQTLPFALVLHLVLLQGSLQGAAHSQPGESTHRREFGAPFLM